jgi:ERF superfamily
MRTSEQINEISGAASKAWGEIANPVKDKQNPAFKNGGKVSTYADIASGLNAARPVLSKHGLTVFQTQRMEGEMLMLDTRLSHSSGQWIEGEYPVCKFPAKPQDIMAALTYARRGALFSLIGIAGDDDDGNEANKLEIPAQSNKPPVKPAGEFFDVDTSQVTRDTILFAIDLCSSEAQLRQLWAEQAPNIKKLHAADREAVESVKEDKKASLKGIAA